MGDTTQGAAPAHYELKARSMSELIDATFKLYRDHFGPLLALSAVTFAPTAVADWFLERPDPTSLAQIGSVLESFGIAVPLLILGGLLSGGALADATLAIYQGRDWTLGASLARTLRLLPSLIWIGILWVLGLGLGFLFFVVPGIYLGMAWSLWLQVVLVEGKRGGAALGRSRALVRGALRKIGWLFLAFGILALALHVGLGALLPDAGTGMHGLHFLVRQLLNVVMAPLYPALLALLYFDGRIRHEGYDLEVAVAAPPAGA